MDSEIGNDVPVPLEDAAEELSTTGLRLLMLLREGVLTGTEESGVWMITRESIERLKRVGIAVPAQKGCASSCKASTCGCH